MRSHSQYLAGFGGAAFAVACFLIGLEVSATTAAPSARPDLADDQPDAQERPHAPRPRE